MNQQSNSDYYKRAYAVLLSRLQQARLDSGFSQQEVAELLGKNQSYVSRTEQGERRIDVIELQIFAKIYNKTIEYFLMFDDE